MASELREPDRPETATVRTQQAPSSTVTGQGDPGRPPASTAQEPAVAEGAGPAAPSAHTRLSATWTGLVLGLLVLVVLIIFIAQNTQRSTVHFFGLDGTAPTAVVILIASVAGALVVVAVAMGRMLQLRISARRSGRDTGHAVRSQRDGTLPARAGRVRQPAPGSNRVDD